MRGDMCLQVLLRHSEDPVQCEFLHLLFRDVKLRVVLLTPSLWKTCASDCRRLCLSNH